MDKKLLIAPSTDPVKTVEGIIEYARIIKDDADMLHCDIMDGVFVQNKTYSYEILKEIKAKVLLPLDVHLMVQKPGRLIKKFAKSGANNLTVHYEAYANKVALIHDLKLINKLGLLCGLSIKPNTNVMEIMPYLSYVDLVLVMSVEPGLSGQKFMENAYTKVSELSRIRKEYNSKYKIEVDGGVNPSIAKKLKECGADIVVSGNFIYKSDDVITAINMLK